MGEIFCRLFAYVLYLEQLTGFLLHHWISRMTRKRHLRAALWYLFEGDRNPTHIHCMHPDFLVLLKFWRLFVQSVHDVYGIFMSIWGFVVGQEGKIMLPNSLHFVVVLLMMGCNYLHLVQFSTSFSRLYCTQLYPMWSLPRFIQDFCNRRFPKYSTSRAVQIGTGVFYVLHPLFRGLPILVHTNQEACKYCVLLLFLHIQSKNTSPSHVSLFLKIFWRGFISTVIYHWRLIVYIKHGITVSIFFRPIPRDLFRGS